MAERVTTDFRRLTRGMPPSQVRYLGSYEAAYARHRVLQTGLRELGVAVDEFRDRSFLPLRWIRLSAVALRTPPRTPIVIGEAGNYLTPVLWMAALARRQIVFDTFVSLKDTFEDRGGRAASLLASGGLWLDRMNCAAAKTVLVDTEQMAAYFVQEIGVEPTKLLVVYVGAETDLFIPQPAQKRRPGRMDVLFYGSFIPLHGVGVILRAAALLQVSHPDVRFTIVGVGPEYARMRALARSLRLANVRLWGRRVPYEELPALIAEADVCLGVFADRPKTMRVVPHKVFQGAASGRAVVTADTPAIREVFSNDDAILVRPGSAESLAGHLAELAQNPDVRRAVAERGMAIVRDNYSPARVAEPLVAAISDLTRTA